MTTRNELEEQIRIKNRRLYELKKKQALLGISADPSIPLEIEEIEKEVKRLRNQAKRSKSEIEKSGASSAELENVTSLQERGISIKGLELNLAGCAIKEISIFLSLLLFSVVALLAISRVGVVVVSELINTPTPTLTTIPVLTATPTNTAVVQPVTLPTETPTPTNTATATPPIPPIVEVPQANLQLEGAAAVQANLITYTLTITNLGPANPVTATILNTFSLPLEGLSAWGAGCDSYTGVITCTMGNLPVNTPSNLTLTVTIHPDYVGPITTTATIIDTGDIINTNPNNSMSMTTMIEPPPPIPTPTPIPQPCPVRLISPGNDFTFKANDEVTLIWSSPGSLSPDQEYVVSFVTVDGVQVIAQFATQATSSTKPALADHWLYPNDEWINGVQTGGDYSWFVQVRDKSTDQILCASESWRLRWLLN